MAQLRFKVTRVGLEVPVWVGLINESTNDLVAAGQPVPAPIQGRGLLDTGSDLTAVESSILVRLGAPYVGFTTTQTASGSVQVPLYRVSLGITDPSQPPGSPWVTQADLLVTKLATALPDLDVLVGLDVLLECTLVLDGRAREFTISQ
jgi:hypothetical protein